MTFKDRYIGVEYFGIFQFYNIPTYSDPIIITPFFATLLELRTKEGGLKKQWYYTQDKNNPIESIDCELTEKGCGLAKIVFSQLMFPVDASDIVRIRYKGNLLYEGIVDNDVDISDPVMTCSPLWKRYDELLFTGTFPSGTYIITILQSLVTTLEADSGIAWDLTKVTLVGTPPTLEVAYSDARASDVIGQLLELAGEMHYWGVGTDRKFFVKRYDDSDPIVKRLYVKDVSEFKNVTITEDYSKIEMTEAVVYKKSETDSGEVVKIGQIANYGNLTYPYLDISYKIRRKVGKIVASEYVLDGTAMTWAYEWLKKHVQLALSVKISDIDITKYAPVPGDKILVEGNFEPSMLVVVDCDSSTGWTNGHLTTGEGKDNNDAIRLFYDGSSSSYFDFGRNVSYYKQQRVGFFMKGPVGSTIEVAVSKSLTPAASEYVKFCLPDNDLLGYFDIETSDEFRYIHFNFSSGIIYVDDIQVFCHSKKQIMTDIKKVKMKWAPAGIQCDAEGGDIKNPETSQLESLNRKIKILEAIASI